MNTAKLFTKDFILFLIFAQALSDVKGQSQLSSPQGYFNRNPSGHSFRGSGDWESKLYPKNSEGVIPYNDFQNNPTYNDPAPINDAGFVIPSNNHQDYANLDPGFNNPLPSNPNYNDPDPINNAGFVIPSNNHQNYANLDPGFNNPLPNSPIYKSFNDQPYPGFSQPSQNSGFTASPDPNFSQPSQNTGFTGSPNPNFIQPSQNGGFTASPDHNFSQPSQNTGFTSSLDPSTSHRMSDITPQSENCTEDTHKKCIRLRLNCTTDLECCTQKCKDKKCVPSTRGPCFNNNQCISNKCNFITCACGCKEVGEQCSSQKQCCGGECKKKDSPHKECICVGLDEKCKVNEDCCNFNICEKGKCITNDYSLGAD